jgi:hypothetical protein
MASLPHVRHPHLIDRQLKLLGHFFFGCKAEGHNNLVLLYVVGFMLFFAALFFGVVHITCIKGFVDKLLIDRWRRFENGFVALDEIAGRQDLTLREAINLLLVRSITAFGVSHLSISNQFKLSHL